MYKALYLSSLKMTAIYTGVWMKALATGFDIWLNNKQVLKARDNSFNPDLFLHN